VAPKPKPITYPPIKQNKAPHIFLGLLLGLALSSMAYVVQTIADRAEPPVECKEGK
jgi:hypothetical protein